MTSRGLVQTIILIIVIIAIVLIVYFGRSLYERDNTKFGTWSEFSQSICLNENEVCTVSGKSERRRVCTPNTTTGFGCIDTSGNQTFRPEIVQVDCSPTCYSSIWSENQNEICKVYDDINGTTVASNQSCVNPDQYRYTKVFRTCVAKDGEGSNACIRQNGSVANVGEIDEFLETCETMPECFPGTWQNCTSLSLNNITEQCSLVDTDCGRNVATTTTANCLYNGNIVSTSLCFPPDDPGPCPATCFSYPCDGAWPAGFSNISSYLGLYLEIFDGVNALEPDWVYVNIAANPDPIETVALSNVVTIYTPAAHPFQIGQSVDVMGISGPDVNGIPVAELNGLRTVISIAAMSFTINTFTNATSSGIGGGAVVLLEQDPETAVGDPTEVIQAYGPIGTTFANTANDERMRFNIVPSQAEVAMGAFYLLGYLPFSGQLGLIYLNGSDLELRPNPVLAPGETFDDVLPRPDMFTLSGASAPFTLNSYTLPGSVETPLYCGAACITLSGCPNTFFELGEVCI
tara:strand:+ start:97 stop:1647 length:1551 start_codon:yes stop_codon:yes gene_type:complete